MYFYKLMCSVVIVIFVPQFGLANREAALEESLDSCGSNLQASQDQDLLNRNLFKAITTPDYRATRKALKAGADPNAALNLKTLMKDQVVEEGTVKIDSHSVNATALHTAVIVGNPYIVNLLLEFKAKTDIKDSLGFTAFSLLAYQNHINNINRRLMVEFFIASGPTESDITDAFYHSATVWNVPVAEAIADYAPESEVIRDLIRLTIFDRIGYVITVIYPFSSTVEIHKEYTYRLMSDRLFKRMLKQGLLK